jgi:hypothetical protein
MSNCEVTNMFYSINSVFGFTPIGGQVTISDSSFNQLNICGSVIKNTYSDVGKPDVNGYVNYEVLTDY